MIPNATGCILCVGDASPPTSRARSPQTVRKTFTNCQRWPTIFNVKTQVRGWMLGNAQVGRSLITTSASAWSRPGTHRPGRAGRPPQARTSWKPASAVAALNMVVAGGTQAGKTTMLNALASSVPGRDRTISCEEVLRLRLVPDNRF